MKKICLTVIMILIFITVIYAGSEKFENKNYQDFVELDDIIKDTTSLGGAYTRYYSKYINYIAPNGREIKIIAQDKVSDEQMLYAYNILSFYLESFGNQDKASIANKMADNHAVIVMPNGADGESSIPDRALQGQPLYQNETPNIGSKWYVENDYEHRDAAFEEIFHLVHDYGIGTTQNLQADKVMSRKIADAMKNALPVSKSDWGKKGLWGLNSKYWLLELEREESLEQEYIVSVIDSYYGLWEAFTETKGGMWGIYTSKTREEIEKKDPMGFKIVKEYLPEHITTMMRIDPEFEGTFLMSYDEAKRYTFKSQYLKTVRLIGTKDSNISGNGLDNVFIGNSGNNIIDGKVGNDVVQFSGLSDEYRIEKKNGAVTVFDSITNRDGTDQLRNIEILRFRDMDITL